MRKSRGWEYVLDPKKRAIIEKCPYFYFGECDLEFHHRKICPSEECVCADLFGYKARKESECIMNDPVNHPSHYTYGKIECIDFITDKGLNFCRGNAVKYIVRAGHKDPNKEVEDLEKAIFYINKEIECIKEAQKVSDEEKG